MTRMFFRCGHCKARWTQEVQDDVIDTSPYTGAVTASFYTVVSHGCDRYREECNKYADPKYPKLRSYAVESSPVQWKERKDRKLTKCDSRCQGAVGPKCDCVCHGANHGGGAL